MAEKKISVMIPTYNCAHLLQKTIESVLDQDLGEELMQIEVIDDCSSDNPEQIVKDFGRGRVRFFRQEKNVRHVKNFQTAIQRAEGEIIHLLHGDDYVLPGFYEAMLKMYADHSEIKACFSRNYSVNGAGDIIHSSSLMQETNGVLKDFFSLEVTDQFIQTPSITVKKEVYQTIGTFNPTLSWTEDWEMWARIAKHYPMGYITAPLACYRVHDTSSTSQKKITGENVLDLIRLKKILMNHCDTNELREKCKNSLNRIIFEFAIKNYVAASKVDKALTRKHLVMLIKYAPNFKSKVYHVLIYIRMFLFYKS